MGSLPFLLSRPMTLWIERRDELADGTAMDGGNGAEQWRMHKQQGCGGGEDRLRRGRGDEGATRRRPGRGDEGATR
jgi:hypothetical protein